MKMRLWFVICALAFALSPSALAQTSACPYPLQYGQVLTTAQWNACINAGLSALPVSGGILTGPLVTTSSTTTSAGLNIPYGSAPISPNPGDLYNAASGLRIYDNGAWNLLVGTQTASPAQGDIIYFNGTKWVDLAPGTSGYFLETLGPGANPQWAVSGGGSGCTVSGGAQYQIIVNNGVSGCSTSANASVNVGALSLGAPGTLGSVQMGNATSGTVTLRPTTGALGSVTASLPANTGMVAELNLAQTWTAVQTITNSDLALLGSSTGSTTFTSANTGPSNYTLTVPAVTDTMVTLAAGQTLTNKSISGSTNTLSNIGNGSLSNSSITIAGHSVALGGSQSLSCSDITGAGSGCSANIQNIYYTTFYWNGVSVVVLASYGSLGTVSRNFQGSYSISGSSCPHGITGIGGGSTGNPLIASSTTYITPPNYTVNIRDVSGATAADPTSFMTLSCFL